MVKVRNLAKERLQAGEFAIGVGLRQARTVNIGKIMKTAGYDFLFIDMEHNSMSIDLAAQISVAAQDAGWFARLEDIARHVLALRERGEYEIRVDRLPYYDRPQIPSPPPAPMTRG